jgi:putative queuosine salvage protein
VAGEAEGPITDQVRSACAWVAGRARLVEIEERAIDVYAAELPAVAEASRPNPKTELVEGDRETRAAFVICLDAINFGSGWWPTIRKRPGHSGYFTIAAGLTERFRARGPWTAGELRELAATEVAEVLGQDAEHPLMEHYADALRDVGEHVLTEHGGLFEAVIESARGSAVALADLLAGWRAFADVSTYDGRPVPFFKRAQIAAADVDRMGLAGGSAPGSGRPGTFRDIDRLTAFADNLVPHVLCVDGVLRLDPTVEARIEAGELLEHGSPEEVELRACAVHAIELLAAATPLSPAEIDAVLWNRGGARRYKSLPRPRSRNTAY